MGMTIVLWRVEIWIGHWISSFCLTGNQLFLGVHEPLTFTHYQENYRRLSAGRENTDFYYGPLCSAAHQWRYIAEHVQLTQDRWPKFTSNQERSDGLGSPHRPMGPTMASLTLIHGSVWHVWSGDSIQVYPLWNWNACQRVFTEQYPSVFCNTDGSTLQSL